jgi:transposase
MWMVCLGIDWAERSHDMCAMDEQGAVLFRRRIADSVDGFLTLQRELASLASDASQVVIGIETPRGLLVRALRASGYLIYPINPMAVSRYRERHAVSGAKSDRADAKLLADLIRTDRHNHRPLPEDSELGEAVKILARSHKALIWTRQGLVNQLRSALLQFYPGALRAFGNDLDSNDALAILRRAPAPAQGRSLSLAKIGSLLRDGGRRRKVEARAAYIYKALREPQLEQPTLVAAAFAKTVLANVSVLGRLNSEVAALEAELGQSFELHPDAEIYRSQPGLGTVLGARVFGEFGDDPNRFLNAKSRRNFARTSPITKASGTRKVIFARFSGNDRLADACQWWAFAALSHSPGARRYYELQRARGKSYQQALRALANRLVGILHGCLRHRRLYCEEVAWPTEAAAA